MCYDSEPEKIIHNEMQVDGFLEYDDNFTLILDEAVKSLLLYFINKTILWKENMENSIKPVFKPFCVIWGSKFGYKKRINRPQVPLRTWGCSIRVLFVQPRSVLLAALAHWGVLRRYLIYNVTWSLQYRPAIGICPGILLFLQISFSWLNGLPCHHSI